MSNRVASSAASVLQSEESEDGSRGKEGCDLDARSSASDLLTIAAAHWQLGFRPPAKLLVASGPFLAARSDTLSTNEQDAAHRMMTDFDFEFSRQAFGPLGFFGRIVRLLQGIPVHDHGCTACVR